jgi:hypothetical protein
MARLTEQNEKEESEEALLSKTTIYSMIISNLFWLIVISTAICLNLNEKESMILRNWNYLILTGCILSTISLSIYLKTQCCLLLLAKVLIRTCLGIIYLIVILAQFFTRYHTNYSKTLQCFDLAFGICEVIYLCIMLSSVDNYYYEENYRREKLKRQRDPYTDYSSI